MYVVTGCLQGVLLGMGIYYEVLERRRRVLGEGEGEGEGDGAVGDGDVNGDLRGSRADREGRLGGSEETPERNEWTPLLREGG